MRWLALFFLLAFTGGDVLIQPLVYWVEPAGDHRSLALMLLVDCIFVLPATAVGALIRFAAGRLSGFTAGLIAVASCLATVNVIYGSWMVTELTLVMTFCLSKFLGPIVLARVPVFRERALGWPPRREPRGLAGTHAFRLADGDSLAEVLGRRSAGERRWARMGVGVPPRWDDGVARLVPAPRRVSRALAWAVALRGRSAAAWWWVAAGFLVLAADVRVNLTTSLSADRSHPLLWLQFGLLLLALALIRKGGLRLVEATRLVGLLRHGELTFATPQPQIIPGAWSVVATTKAGGPGIGVETPRPTAPGAQQGLLIDRPRRTVVAWDLLPHVPAIDPDGQLATPAGGQVVPWLAGPLAALISLAALAGTLVIALGRTAVGH